MKTKPATLVLQGPRLKRQDITRISTQLGATSTAIKAHYCRLDISQELSLTGLNTLRKEFNFDINQLPADFTPAHTRLLLMDMDSTLINIECIDEIADFLSLKNEVSEITEAAMNGEIDFYTSMRQRIQLLGGMTNRTLQHVYEERLQLNPGVEIMLREVKKKNITTALISGGFTYFTHRLQKQLNLDYSLANELDFDAQGKLKGLKNNTIIGAQQKSNYLNSLCATLHIKNSQSIAIGDGANDLLMMASAGLSVAYHAKPTVQEKAHTVLNYCGLEGILGLLDIDYS